MLEGIMKNIDPVVAHILNEALDLKDISINRQLNYLILVD